MRLYLFSLLLVSSLLPLVVVSGSMHYYTDRLSRTKEFIAKFEREHPTDDNNNNNNEHVSEKQSSTTNNKSDRYEQFQAMRSKIQKVKASVPTMQDEDDLFARTSRTIDNSTDLYYQDTSSKTADSHYQEEASPNNKDTTSTNNEEASQQRALNYMARYQNMQTFVSGIQTLDLRSAENVDSDDDNDVLRLTLTKPLGIVLDEKHDDEAIVLSLDNERPGAAHQLSKDMQEKLVARQITSVNHIDVSDLSLMEVAEVIMEADSPVDMELSIVEEHNVDRDNLLSLTLTKPLGIILNADIDDQAIVFSLDDEHFGAAHELSKHVQKELVGSRIVTVNDEDVSELSLMEVAKRIVALNDSPVQLEFESVEEENDDDVLRLTLDRPFGFILNADMQDEAIVLSLDDEYPGSAHTLSKQVQQQLLGRHIVTVNNEDVSNLPLMAVAERLVNADCPVKLEFAVVEDEMDEGDDDEEDKTIDYYDDYLKESVAPGQLSLLKWKDEQQVIDPYAAIVGLPPKLVPTIQAYASRLGIIDMLKDILYKSPCKPEGGRFYKTEYPHNLNSGVDEQLEFLSQLKDREELSWYVQRPGMHWHSDMHWFAPSDENSHEFMVQMLMQGGFNQVLDAIGTHYNLDGLFIQSVGFLGVTHCEEGFLHDDFKDVDGKFFNLLLPVYSPEGAGEELNVAGKRYGKDIVGTKIKYDPEFGVLVGDRALHGTREVDHQPQDEIRVVLSIYLADLTESNIDNVSSDDTAIFPVPGATDWLWAQRGRHWRKDQCVAGDTGRQPFKAIDKSLGCSDMARSGDCESDAKFARTYCPQSCKVYMHDTEYQPGVERRDVMGDLDLVVV